MELRRKLTVNMKCFEITEEFGVYAKIEKLTVNMKCFEIVNYDKTILDP